MTKPSEVNDAQSAATSRDLHIRVLQVPERLFKRLVWIAAPAKADAAEPAPSVSR